MNYQAVAKTSFKFLQFSNYFHKNKFFSFSEFWGSWLAVIELLHSCWRPAGSQDARKMVIGQRDDWRVSWVK